MIQKSVQDPLAEAILSGTVKDGDTVPVTTLNGALVVGDLLVSRKPAEGASGDRARLH